MTNTTDTYWSADGVSLQTYAQNISSLGSRLAPAPFRGSDIVIPYSPGQRWIPKTVDSRTIPLGMWIRGYGDDGSLPSGSKHDKFIENWVRLRNLLWTPGRQFDLQKRVKVAGVTHQVTAKAEYESGLEPTMIGPHGAKFVVDLKLADPYFYDDDYTTFNLVNGEQTISVPGDADTSKILLTINGSRTEPKVRVVNSHAATEVEYNGSLLSGDSVRIDIKNYEAETTPSGQPSYDSSGRITHFGAPQWLILAPGTNTVTVSSDAGIGSIQLQVKGAWL